MSDVADRPDDIEALKAILRDMSAQVAARDAEISRHEAQLRHHALMIAKLKARLSKQLRDQFGSSAESLEQLQLMLEDLKISHTAPTFPLPLSQNLYRWTSPFAGRSRITCRAATRCLKPAISAGD